MHALIHEPSLSTESTWQVVITYTSPSSASKAQTLVDKIKSLPNSANAISVRADMSDLSSPKTIIDATTQAFGPKIDILVNNAAQLKPASLPEITQEDYDKHFNVNVRGVVMLTQAMLPHLRAPGRIINVSSVAARTGNPAMSLYGSSKAALEGLTRNWAAELGHDGTTVNAVAPGPVQSEMLDDVPRKIVEKQKEATSVERRVGRAEEIAGIVGWLAGPESSWVSGQVINASGGWTMY